MLARRTPVSSSPGNPAPVIHDTFVIERSYPHDRAWVFGYLADPAKKRRWYAADGDGATFAMDFREGGAERSSSKMGASTPFPGAELANSGTFEDIVTNVRVVMATSMTLAGRRISTSLITFELFDDGDGTKLVMTHQACFYEGSGGPEMRADGWRRLLDRLARAMAD
ncbi:MAG: SRPBCC domain-containing protein [Proteobacteria bacterium]|nr:SRPBCC domain-containing protein [Pseudomonadota bacterium]